MTQPKRNKVDLDTVPPEQRERIERVLYPRDTALGTRHRSGDVEKWKKEAKEAKLSFVDWVERKLNA